MGFHFVPTDQLAPRPVSTPLVSVVSSLEDSSFVTAPVSWLFVGIGALIWRGKTRALWQEYGFDKDVFRLLLKMRGGSSRVKLLKALLVPKDRLQLAKEIGLDWKTVDRHTKMLQEYGLIQEQVNVGRNIRLYTLTKVGEMLLNILDKMEEFEKEYTDVLYRGTTAQESK